ncbi:MAG: 3-hydroxyacyl-CoA dehydrogenase NAD-binding domain-containing protein, partial [Mariprofundaceae bacterium]
IAGADLKLIQSVDSEDAAVLLAERGQMLCRRIEQLDSVSLVVVHGACMGGGLEIALSCDYIIAVQSPKTKLALPEIKIGIHPGFGGCVRLPKRVGWDKAVEMILTGRSVDAKKARRMGLADVACHEEQIESALLHLSSKGKRVDASVKPWWFQIWPLRALFFHLAERKARAKFSHLELESAYPAIPAVLKVLKDIYGAGDGVALAREAASLGELALSPTCKHLIRVFFLGEALKKQDAAKKGKKAAADIQRTAVYGAGVMGSGIAWVAAKHGEVDLHELAEEPLGRGMKAVASFAKRDRNAGERRLQRIRPVLDNNGLSTSHVVIEAVLEDVGVKQALWQKVESEVAKETLLMTNTSSLSVSEQQTVLKHPGRLVGLHFFNPAPKMPLVDIIAGKKTHKKTVQTAVALAVSWGKFPIVVADCPGFLVNRCLMPFMSAALKLLEQGQKLEHIDGALKTYGMPMGAIELADRVGLDICHHVGAHLSETYGERMAMPDWFDQMVDDGLLGVKSGKGFYNYEGSQRKDVAASVSSYLANQKQPEHEFDANLKIESSNDQSRTWADRDIVNFCLIPMLLEALMCLQENVVENTEHLDAAMIYGIGYPPFRGGLLHDFAHRTRADLEQVIKDLGYELPVNLEVLYG